MKIKVRVDIDQGGFDEPVHLEFWRDISGEEARDFYYPQRPFFEGMTQYELPIAMMDYQKQIERNKNFVQMISAEIATAFGRALGNKGPDR